MSHSNLRICVGFEMASTKKDLQPKMYSKAGLHEKAPFGLGGLPRYMVFNEDGKAVSGDFQQEARI